MKKGIITFIFALSFIAVQAETNLSGEIKSSTLDASGNPYIVEKDIIVPSGKQLRIKEGCIFLFNNFAGLNVNGDLSVEGSIQKPVIFSCVNDGDFNSKSQQLPNPFDWNGIIISKESGSVHFQNFQLRYSVYGIKSQNTTMTIQNGLFRQNGQFHFTLNDKIQYVQDNISYSFNAVSDSEDTKNHKSTSGKPLSNTKKILRYSCLCIGVVGIVAGTIFALEASNTNDKITEIQNHPELYTEEQYNDKKDALDSQHLLTGISFGLGAAGILGFTATFVF
jgi:hypothetical protein